MKQIYIKINDFINKTNSLSYQEFLKQRESIIEEFNTLLNNNEFDINEIIEDYKIIPYRHITPLYYLLNSRKQALIDISIDKFKTTLNPTIKISSTLELELLSVLYSSLSYKDQKTDVLVPLIFHFESLEFLQKENSTIKKITILEFLLSNSFLYNHSETFIKTIENKLEENYIYKEKLILSTLKLTLNQSLNEFDILKKPLNDKMKQIKDEINKLKQLLNE